MVNGKVYFEKEIKNNFKITIHDSDGFNQDGFIRKRFQRNRFIVNGIVENGINRSEKKIIQAKRGNSWNIFYVSEVFRNKDEIMKECVKSDPFTYQNATLQLKQSFVLAIIILERGGSFSLISKHLLIIKKGRMIAVKINLTNFQYVVKNI